MINVPKIEIKSVGDHPNCFTEIYIDGHKINGVRRFRLEQESGNSIPTLTIDINALLLSTDTMALLTQEGMGDIESIRFKNGYEAIFSLPSPDDSHFAQG